MSLSQLFSKCLLGAALTWFFTPSDLNAQAESMKYLNGNQPLLDAHNCYPYEEHWADRVDRALKTGFPVGIEQDLAWFQDPNSKEGRVVVSHKTGTTGTEPDEKQYFFEHVRPMIERELKSGDQSRWPLIVLHFDFKDVRPELLHAVWKMLGEYEDWITTAPVTADPHQLGAFNRRPILVLTEDSDAQEKVFFNEVPQGARLRIFGSVHANMPKNAPKEQLAHLAATMSPDQLLTERATNYRRWWNGSWHEVEEGGQPKSGDWSDAENARLRALVSRAHDLGLWIRFYTLDGFTPEQGKQNGWFEGYNFGSRAAVEQRWKAAIEAGVNLIATDQYEDFAAFLKTQSGR
jgi:hypothetical protein